MICFLLVCGAMCGHLDQTHYLKALRPVPPTRELSLRKGENMEDETMCLRFFIDFGLHSESPERSFWRLLDTCCKCIVGLHPERTLVRKKEGKRSSPGGVDMQSVHACACFVRIGRCCLGSILGSIWESFWEASSPLYSFLVALVANRPPK